MKPNEGRPLEVEEEPPEGVECHAAGILPALGELGAGAVIFEEALAEMTCRHVVSIRRAVKRGELPRPTRLLGRSCWTAGALVRHIEERLQEEKAEAERTESRIRKLSP